MNCGPEFQPFAPWQLHFQGNTEALPQKHLSSLGDSSNVQQTVVGEETGVMGPQTENDLCATPESCLSLLEEGEEDLLNGIT